MARREELIAYLFISPWIIGFLVLLAGPIIASIFISMTNWSIISDPEWVGLDNYHRMFYEDRNFWISIKVTAKYTLYSVPTYMIASLAVSLLLNLKLKGMNFFRTLLYLPAVLSSVAVAVLWVSLLHPDLGAINVMLRQIGIDNPPRWLNSRQWAVPAVVLMGLWGVGGGAIIYLAGLQNIPPILYEAAEIDGASALRKFRHITLPMLTPTLFFTLITGLIGSIQVFDAGYVLGGPRGGHGRALLFYVLYLYNEGFRNGRLGYASAMAWVLVVVAGILIVIVFRAGDRWVYYESEEGRA